MATVKQWVNLPKDNKFVGDGISSLERLDFLHFKTEFKKADPSAFKAIVIPTGSGNIKYSKKEQKRHKAFQIRKQPPQFSDSKKTHIEQDVYLPPAGGNQYKIKAKYGKKVVESKMTVEVWRRLFYQVISMKGVRYLSSFKKFEDAFKDEKNKFFIELKEKDNGRNKMKLIETIYDSNGTSLTGNGSDFRDEARKVYSIDKYRPYAVAVVFLNYIADPVRHMLTDTVTRNIPSKLFFWEPNDEEIVLDITDRDGNYEYLWHGMIQEHDKNKKWLISANFKTKDNQLLKISPDDITYTSQMNYGLGGRYQLKVSLKSIRRKFFSKIEGKILIKLYIVDGFSGGFSYTSLNLITVATRSWWDTNPATNGEMLQTLNHEMGHKVGMVGYGDKNHPKNSDFTYRPMLPDSPKHIYGENRNVNNKTHLGPHCGNGASFNHRTQEWTGTPVCVMFGSNGTATAFTPAEFCSECAPVVRKLDINGKILSGLKNAF